MPSLGWKISLLNQCIKEKRVGAAGGEGAVFPAKSRSGRKKLPCRRSSGESGKGLILFNLSLAADGII
jgi:hypothetical protein